MLKYLRIAVTALCLAACVLLVALWVRSYRWQDTVYREGNGIYIFISSRPGLFVIEWTHFPTDVTQWVFDSDSYLDTPAQRHSQFLPFVLYGTRHADVSIFTPYWLLTFVVLLFAALPCKPRNWRFSLRTLLIATTLVALGLGIVVMSR
jgi:hypothetical protein